MKSRRFMLATGLCALVFSAAHARDMPRIDPDSIVAKYGKPDVLKSTERDRPRPPMVTRMYEYRRENVRIVLLADAPVGAPPPYSSWRLIGYQDPRDNSVLTEQIALTRLSGRRPK